MFTGNKENSADSLANRTAQKSPKERTMAGGPVNNPAYIDITKPLTQQERALLNQRMQDLHGDTNPVYESYDTLEHYYPGKYSENNFVEINAAKNGYISSYVGNCTSNPAKGIVANLGKDVFYVQKHLNRLGILSDKDYAKEKPPTGKEISKNTIPATIEAIGFYQERILHKAKASVDKEVWPGYGTIKSLATITLSESRIKHFEFIKKKIRTKYEETIEKLAAEREAEIERIKNEPATNETVSKLYEQFDDVGEFGKALKDYAIYNPQFVLKAFELADFGEPDNLTRAIMHKLSDAEIEQLPQALDTKFYEALDAGWTVDEEYELMKKLKKGRGVKYDTRYKDNIASKDLATVRKIVGYSLSGSVGQNGNNYIGDVSLVAKKLKEKYKVNDVSISNGKCDKTLIEAIGKFQTDNKLLNKKGEPDFVIDPGYGSYKKLFSVKRIYTSGVEDIHSGRNTVAAVLNRNVPGKEKTNSNYTLEKLNYNSATGNHTRGTASKDYYEKMDVLAEKMNLSKDSDVSKILSIARKAAMDQSYFNEFTKDVSAKLALTPEVISDNGVNLSPALIERMRKYHKFLSATGMFKGDMYSGKGGGVRSAETAHIWCGQWIIAAEGAGSSSGATYVSQTKKILLEMYQEQKKTKSLYVMDLDKNKWAKKEHFKEDKEGIVTMDWAAIKKYVATIEGGRTSYTAPAASGYEKDIPERRPVPPGRPGNTNHKTGEAIDINSKTGFQNRQDSVLDLIGLNFGVVRNGGPTEWWHYELTDLQLSKTEEKISKDKT